MKKLFKLTMGIIMSSLLVSCVSTPKETMSPAEINYKEISADDYFGKRKSNNNNELVEMFSNVSGYKVTGAFIIGSTKKQNGEKRELLIEFRGSDQYYTQKVYGTEYATNQNDSSWAERIDAVADNKNYNGNYTLYLYAEKSGDIWNGYNVNVILYNIEGIPSAEQIEADKAEEAKIKAEEEAAKAQEEAEKNAKIETAAKTIAKGYVYHGILEKEQNAKLFAAGALEEGHAYYISSFMIGSGGATAAAITSFFGNPTYHLVNYANQAIKGDVVGSSQTIFGALPVSVVVAGGKGFSKIPIVLGLVE